MTEEEGMYDDATYDEDFWFAYYTPIRNPYSGYCLFDTEGESAKLVADTAKFNRVWTWVDGGEGEIDLLVNGYYPEHAKGYYISQRDFIPTQQIKIPLEKEYYYEEQA